MNTKQRWVTIVLFVFVLVSVAAAPYPMLRTWNTNKLVLNVSGGAPLSDYTRVCGTTSSGQEECTPKYTTTGKTYKVVTWWFKVGEPITVEFTAKTNDDLFWPASCEVTLPSSYKTSAWTTITLLGHGECDTENGYHP